MTPLGLQITTIGALGATGVIEAGRSVVVEDYFWEIHATAGAGFLTPVLQGTVSDFHDTWDLAISGGGVKNYKPQTVATVSDEGYWDVHTISSGNDAIKPLDV